MSRRQRIVLVVGGILLVAAIACPPWSYYGGEWRMQWPQRVVPREEEEVKEGPVPDDPLGLRNWMQQNPRVMHGIRGILILVIFVGTVTLYLTQGSPRTERPGRPTRLFWITYAAIAACALATLIWTLLLYLTGPARES